MSAHVHMALAQEVLDATCTILVHANNAIRVIIWLVIHVYLMNVCVQMDKVQKVSNAPHIKMSNVRNVIKDIILERIRTATLMSVYVHPLEMVLVLREVLVPCTTLLSVRLVDQVDTV